MTKKYKKFIVTETLIILGIFLIYLFINSVFINKIPKCIIKENLGILCPGCGGTTCIINILKGDFLGAAKAHIIIFIAILYFIILNIVYIINTFKKKKIMKFIYPKILYIVIWIIMYLIFEILRNI